MPTKISPLPVPGIISTFEAYTLAEVKSRLGLGGTAMRVAFRNGLRAKKLGTKKLLLGSDIIDYLKKQEDCNDL